MIYPEWLTRTGGRGESGGDGWLLTENIEVINENKKESFAVI